jgi:hypothetical protein
MEAKPPWHHFGGKAIGSDPQKKIKLKSSKEEGEFMIWRTKLRAMVPRQGSTQRIQFASN